MMAASTNPRGNDCPQALKLIACVLLYEITAFLRETYQQLPKASKLSTKEKPAPWEKVYRFVHLLFVPAVSHVKSARNELTVSHFGREANRRWSMALSSMGHSQTSAQSLQSIAGVDPTGQTERKISFVLHEPDNESEGSSNTTVTVQGEENAAQPASAGVQQRRPVAPVRPFLLRRGTSGAPTGGSFKRRSLKLRRGTKDGKDIETDCEKGFLLSVQTIVYFILIVCIFVTVRRTDSIQSKRKVSSLSDRSDTSEPGAASGGEESPGILRCVWLWALECVQSDRFFFLFKVMINRPNHRAIQTKQMTRAKICHGCEPYCK